jgi:large subunit ribosomal protein L18
MRRKIQGTAERPRMSVWVTDRHMSVQFIDDMARCTVAAVSTQGAEMRTVARPTRVTVETAKRLGVAAARAAKEKGIEAVVFDRGGFRYGGRVRALAEAAREGGLRF